MKNKLIKAAIGLILISAFLLGAHLDNQTLSVVNNF